MCGESRTQGSEVEVRRIIPPIDYNVTAQVKVINARKSLNTRIRELGITYEEQEVQFQEVSSHGEVGFGDLNAGEAAEYLTAYDGEHEDGGHTIQNVIKTGTRVEDDGFAFLTDAELDGLTYEDFGTQNIKTSQTQTFGFKLDLGKLPEGNAILTLLEECINDGMAITVTFPVEKKRRVPEPGSIAALAFIGGGMFLSRRRQSH